MPYYVAIEGVIGVGKTTLARYLERELRTTLLLEEFEENPFLSKFYQDRARYAFQTQVFFLLSRYDQQHRINQLPRPLVSDYIFAKDHLFAEQNLSGDELTTYQRVYEALAANIPSPDLLVYLRADTPVLMAQIARRDRPYERNMDPDYIEKLRVAYEQFVTEYTDAPVLTIDTNELDFVQNEDERTLVIDQIRGKLGVGPRQAALPGLRENDHTVAINPIAHLSKFDADDAGLETSERRLGDFQRFHHEFDQLHRFDTDLFLNFALLQEEIGELSHELITWWRDHEDHKPEVSDALSNEFADVLAYLLKLANYTGIDLETAYLRKMKVNQQRQWGSPQG
ncbi:MAG: deoxynucleoside kinase [Chloroflexi bacterium]|nr:deoxynucleoside kinase [Chloroflexota bacterium]